MERIKIAWIQNRYKINLSNTNYFNHDALVPENLPSPNLWPNLLNWTFHKNHLYQINMIAISSDYTMGFSYPGSFSNHLYSSSASTVPLLTISLKARYAQQLMAACPKNMDPVTPQTFDNITNRT